MPYAGLTSIFFCTQVFRTNRQNLADNFKQCGSANFYYKLKNLEGFTPLRPSFTAFH